MSTLADPNPSADLSSSPDNVFVALRRYAARPDHDPAENFLTEALAWVLRASPELAAAYIDFCVGARLKQAHISFRDPVISTQMSSQGCRFDLVATSNGAAVVFEHKLWSAIGEAQLDRYIAAARERWPTFSVVVLITPRGDIADTPPDVHLTWSTVYKFIAGWLMDHPRRAPLADHLLGLLENEGLGPAAPISHEAILSYFPAMGFEEKVRARFERLQHADFSFIHDHLAWPGQKNVPSFEQPRKRVIWGRLGLAIMAGPWRPGVFFGVMFDGSNHLLELSARHLGPDVCLILSFDNRRPVSPSRAQYLDSPEFAALRRRLAQGADGWDVKDTLADPGGNHWHVIHLRRPLLEVMRGTRTADEQDDALLAAAHAAADVLFRGGELSALRARLILEGTFGSPPEPAASDSDAPP